MSHALVKVKFPSLSEVFLSLQINKEYLKNLESLCLVCNYASAPKAGNNIVKESV